MAVKAIDAPFGRAQMSDAMQDGFHAANYNTRFFAAQHLYRQADEEAVPPIHIKARCHRGVLAARPLPGAEFAAEDHVPAVEDDGEARELHAARALLRFHRLHMSGTDEKPSGRS